MSYDFKKSLLKKPILATGLGKTTLVLYAFQLQAT